MLKFLEDIKDNKKSDYRIYCETGFNPSLENCKIIKYRDNKFKCPDCGRIVFFLLADGSKTCFKCWKPEHENFYKEQCENIPLKGFKYIFPKPSILPLQNKYFLEGVEAYYIYNRQDQQIRCSNCNSDLFTRCYNFLNVCMNCGSMIDSGQQTKPVEQEQKIFDLETSIPEEF